MTSYPQCAVLPMLSGLWPGGSWSAFASSHNSGWWRRAVLAIGRLQRWPS